MPERRKICFVSLQARGAFFPESPGKIGGAEVQVALLANWLARHGDFEPVVIVEDRGQPEREQAGGVALRKIHQPPEGKGPLARLWRKAISGVNLWRAIRAEHPDVTVQRGEGVETGIAQHAARSVDSTFIFMTSHDPGMQSPWLDGRRLAHRLFRRGLRRADGVICQHDGQLKRLDRLPTGQPMRVLASLYDFSAMESSRGEAVLWMGRCGEVKGPLAFLELARTLPGVPFLMVAKPTDHERALFERVKAEAEALPNLTLIPGVTRAETPEIYRRACVLVNTSLREGMPNVFLEATQYGLALASLNVDPGGMFLQKGLGICAGGDGALLAEAVHVLTADPASRMALTRRAQVTLRRAHDIKTVGAQFISFLEETGNSGG